MSLSELAEQTRLLKLPINLFVVRVLREAILRGILVGEQPLKQTDIAQEIGVSHIPVREAFRELEAEGLVSVYPNKGAVVVDLIEQDIQEIFDIRVLLETGALRLAFPNITSSVIKRCELNLEEASCARDMNAWGVLNIEFHDSLYEAADSPRLFQMIRKLHTNIDRYMRLFFLKNIYKKETLSEHTAIIDAIKSGDLGKSVKALEKHLTSTCMFLIEHIGESKNI